MNTSCFNCTADTQQICHECERHICAACARFARMRTYCNECFQERFCSCDHCNTIIHNSDAFHSDGSVFCEECYNETYSHCDDCGDAFQRNGSRFCGYCQQSEELQPTTFDIIKSRRRVGMEIEFLPGARLPNIMPFGALVGDGSVYSDSVRGQEFVSSICSGDRLLDLIQNVCREIRSTGGSVNKTCGLHIHLDMNNSTGTQAQNIAAWWQVLEKIIHGMVAPSRRNNLYTYACASASHSSWRSSRYYSLNISDSNGHGTYEARVHQGTLNPQKIGDWVQFLLVFFDTFQDIEATKERLQKVSQMTDREKVIFMFQQLALPMRLKKYMVSRIKKHATDWLVLDKKNKGNPNLRMAA